MACGTSNELVRIQHAPFEIEPRRAFIDGDTARRLIDEIANLLVFHGLWEIQRDGVTSPKAPGILMQPKDDTSITVSAPNRNPRTNMFTGFNVRLAPTVHHATATGRLTSGRHAFQESCIDIDRTHGAPVGPARGHADNWPSLQGR